MINFFSEQIRFSLSSPQKMKEWLAACIKQEKHDTGTVNYIFCSDDYLLQLNKNYLKHDTLTDIITFDYSETKKKSQEHYKIISGDIYISIERIKDNARKYRVPIKKELHRVMIHGILHLCGYEDKIALQKKKMRKKENDCLALLHQNFLNL